MNASAVPDAADRGVAVYQVDAFSERPFAGNPAAVCLLTAARADDWLQSVAAEMNLSETAFLWRADDGWRLRWFTPAAEVDLCGHATLAAAHVLFEEENDAADVLRFHTLSGVLTAYRAEGGIRLDFPAEPATMGPPPAGLLEALGLDPGRVEATGANRLDALVVVDRAAILRALVPDMPALTDLGMRGVIVTAPPDEATPDADFVSRYFAPAFGVPEDPVTGSAHCCLGPYWAERLGLTDLKGVQISKRRGTVGVGVRGDRIELTGRAATVLRGTLIA